MKETIDEYRFCNVMATPYNGFTLGGARKLFDILSDYEEETGVELELDPVAIRCQFTEYANMEDVANDFPEFEEHGLCFWEYDGGVIVDVESY